MVRQRRIAEEYLSHNLDEHYLEDTGVTWCLSKKKGMVGGTIPRALRFLVVKEIDSGNWLARGYMPAHKHCEMFCPLAQDLIGSALN